MHRKKKKKLDNICSFLILCQNVKNRNRKVRRTVMRQND